jgi:1,4-alpha-glucan branching enzyme
MPLLAQQEKRYSVKNGKMLIEVSKQIRETALDSFIRQFNLVDLGLKHFIKTASADSFLKAGWILDFNDEKHFVISKPFAAVDNMNNPADRIILTEKQVSVAARFPSVISSIRYGYNRFKNKAPFAVDSTSVTFFLRNHAKATSVRLTGSFTNWEPNAIAMTRTDSGWIAKVSLNPGKYWYKFIVDGAWIIDTDNQLREADGEGNINSVFYKTNSVFLLNGYTNAKRVIVSGSFNNWAEKELLMTKTDNGWQLPLYLMQGTHTYRFIVDGRWMTDPNSKEQLPNEFGEYNSVLRLGKPYPFMLQGHTGAKQVILTGSFNGWREEELYMTKTASGWELPYVLAPGNYEYKYIVDGQWITDPTNPLTVTGNNNKLNSFLIIEPNYTFRVKSFATAKKVYLAGDFNNWSPNSLAMQKQGEEWVVPIHLSVGKHRYKYVVDGEWKLDPANKLWEQNELGTGNSVLWIDK